jgi:hypothetical protein
MRLRVFKLLTAAACLGLVAFATSGCAGSSPPNTAESTGPNSFQVALPSTSVLSTDDIAHLKGELSTPDGHPPASTLSAAVFDDYSAVPITKNPEWQQFLQVYGSVRTIALENGWNVLVEGYVQSSDPVGTPDPLSGLRAAAAGDALVALGYPADRVDAIGRGVGGPNPGDRRVVISFVRS